MVSTELMMMMITTDGYLCMGIFCASDAVASIVAEIMTKGKINDTDRLRSTYRKEEDGEVHGEQA